MKKTHVSFIIITVVGTVIGVYYLSTKNSTQSPRPIKEDQQSETATTLSREILLAQDFLFFEKYEDKILVNGWLVTERYEASEDNQRMNYIIRDATTHQEVSRIQSQKFFAQVKDDSVLGYIGASGVFTVFGPFVTSQPARLYTLLNDGIRHSPGNPDYADTTYYLYSTDYSGNDLRLIYKDKGTENIPDVRLSPDQKTLGITRYTVATADGNIRDPRFTLLELPSGKITGSFLIPGDADQFSKKNNIQYVDNVVAAWRRSSDNAIEFTRYYATQKNKGVYTQISDKELWSYDIATRKLTLLETIPLK